MLLSRRHETIPLDFEYALTKFLIPTASIEPHLKPPVAPLKPQELPEPLPEEGLNRASLTKLLGEELNGDSEKNVTSYIPKHFPSFPSRHTYKWTEKESARETDPRKIREEAAKGARQAEEALRRLVKISQAGREKDVKRMAEKDPKSKMRHELWEKTMETLSTRKRHTAAAADQDDDRSMIVNSESQYFRKPVVKKRTVAPIQTDG
jgi:transcription initiation factor TFIID subunit 8